MSPLPQTGVEYIGRGFDKFIADLGKAQLAISNMGNMTKNKLLALQMMFETAEKVSRSMEKVAASGNKYNVALAKLQASENNLKRIQEQRLLVQERQAAAVTGLQQNAARTQQRLQEQTVASEIKSMQDQLAEQLKFYQQSAKEAEKDANAKIAENKRAANAIKAQQAQTTQTLIGMTTSVGSGNISSALGAIGGPAGTVLSNLPALLKMTSVGSLISGIGNALGTLGKIASFIATPIKAVGSALVSIGGAVVTGGINAAKGALQLFGSVVSALLSPVKFVGEQLRQVFVVTLGVLVRDAIRGAVQAIQELINMIFEGGTSMQILQIRLQGMLATEIQSTNTTISFTDAMTKAIVPTQKLIDWINVLAVKSPFERSTIADTLSLGMALDFTSEQAKTITSALVDWASGMGLEGDAITRILYNFGQMRAQGKLTGQELRDAARGGLIPVMDILRQMGEQAGLTGAALEKAIHDPAANFTGSDVDLFFKDFIDLAEKRFPNAAERMSRTWSGVTNNIKDFIKTVLGADVLTPVLDKIAGKMADVLNAMLQPEVRNQFKAIGEALSYAFDVIYPSIQRAIRSIQFLAKALGLPEINAVNLAATIEIVADNISRWLDKASTKVYEFALDVQANFDNLSTNALSFGLNTAVQWANGFIQGVETAILKAMNFLNQMLSGWLKGHSPPKVVPDIGNWGAHTFEEWLKGFKDADFSVLDTVGSAVNSALNAMVGLGKLDQGSVGNIYGGILKGLAKGISGGGFSDSFLKKLKSQLGDFGGAIVDLLKKQMAYAQATNAAAAAEKALADAQKAASDQRTKVNGLIKSYNTLLRAGGTRDQLGQKLSVINAEEKTLKLQQDQVAIAQKAADDAKAKAESLKEAADLQDKLVNQLVNLGQAYKINLDTTELTGALGGVDRAIEDTGTAVDGLSQKLEQRVENTQGQVVSISTLIATAKTSIEGTLTEMGNAVSTFVKANFDSSDPSSNAGKISAAFQNIGHDMELFYGKYFDINNPDSTLAQMYTQWVSFQTKLDETKSWFDLLATVIGTSLTIAYEVLKIVIAPIINTFNDLLDLVLGIKTIIEWIIGHPVSDPTGRAGGGGVNQGTSYLVGEKGREIFTPTTNGFIIPNRMTEAIVSRHSAGRVNAPVMSQGATVNVVFENVNINNGMDLAQLDYVIQKSVKKGLG